jgi:hypothetical protein
MALCSSSPKNTLQNCWAVLVTTVAEVLGEAGMQALWADLKHVLQDPQQQAGLPQVVQGALDQLKGTDKCVLQAWKACWGAACKGAPVTERLEQLVIHQQQLDSCAALVNMQSLTLSERPLSASAAGGQLNAIQAATVNSRDQGLHDALRQLRSRAAELMVAIPAASKAENWGLCVALLREMVMLDGTQGQIAFVRILSELDMRKVSNLHEVEVVTQQVLEGLTQQPERLLSMGLEAVERLVHRHLQAKQLPGVLPLCDALLTDWLTLRQRQARGVREAVVAAVKVAAAACESGVVE